MEWSTHAVDTSTKGKEEVSHDGQSTTGLAEAGVQEPGRGGKKIIQPLHFELNGADLFRADMSEVDLNGTNLRGANLATLYRADLAAAISLRRT